MLFDFKKKLFISLINRKLFMNNLNTIYERILEVLRKLSKEQLVVVQHRQPKTSDLGLISLSLTTEYLGIDSKNDLFRKLLCPLKNKIEYTYEKKSEKILRFSQSMNVI